MGVSSKFKYVLLFLKWVLLSVLMGVIGGLLSALFHYALHFVTELRETQNWLIFLLPIGGLATVGIYKLSKLSANQTTDEIVECSKNGKPISPLIAPVIFLTTTITHLLGGSAGREGAALQMGSSVASLLNKVVRLKDKERALIIMTGMSAAFAGLFGTPLTACLFTLEIASQGMFFFQALLPCFISAFVASKVSSAFGVYADTAIQRDVISLTSGNILKLIALIILIFVLGIVVRYMFRKAPYFMQLWIKSPWLRIVIGATVVVIMTLFVGNQNYNGAGMSLALQAIDGKVDWYSFLLKMLFTAVTLGVGFKGGEIVPTFCIGATFGCFIGGVLGLNPGFAAALGLALLFCCVTKSPLASVALSLELFGVTNIHIFAPMCLIVFLLSKLPMLANKKRPIACN